MSKFTSIPSSMAASPFARLTQMQRQSTAPQRTASTTGASLTGPGPSLMGRATRPSPTPGEGQLSLALKPTKGTKPAAPAAGAPSKPKTSKPKKLVDPSEVLARAMKALDLEGDPRLALLCLPDSYSDCRTPVREAPAADDEDRRLYLFTHTGTMLGYSRSSGRSQLVADLGIEGFRPNLVRLMNMVKVETQDARGRKVIWTTFSPWDLRDISSGDAAVMVGRIQWFGDNAYISDVERPPSHAIGKIWVRYLGRGGLVSGETVERLVRAQLGNPDAWRVCAARIAGAVGLRDQDALEAVGAEQFGSLENLLRALHQPSTTDEGYAARGAANRLAALSVQAAALRHNNRPAHPQSPLPIDLQSVGLLAQSQPETLTDEQELAITGIVQALLDPKPLTGLLSGDVGTGKTLTYLIPLVAAHRSGARCAIIAPTELLANQIARETERRFGQFARVERVYAGKKIHDPSAILVGTTGLVSVAQKRDWHPQVLICDEQHKMSADIRERLIRPWTHLLEVSATPIPRTLASALYGGLQVFTLEKCPVKKTIHCEVSDVSERSSSLALIRDALARGEKSAVIYPRTTTKSSEHQTVISAFESFERAFPGKVAMLHGSMDETSKRVTMEQIRANEKPIVIASVIMETGIDIPSISTMIVRDADHFGISQLHQLRGRLVRNGGTGHFVMMVQDKAALQPETFQRLTDVANTLNGYELAEKDLIQRGFGDLEGSDQSGSTDAVFKLVRLRPEDFLARQLAVDIEAPASQDVDDTEMSFSQPRLI